MRDALAAAALLLGVLALVGLRPASRREPPPPLPTSGCTLWMADAIPRVGPRTREQVAERIRAGDVPPAAAGWFVAR